MTSRWSPAMMTSPSISSWTAVRSSSPLSRASGRPVSLPARVTMSVARARRRSAAPRSMATRRRASASRGSRAAWAAVAMTASSSPAVDSAISGPGSPVRGSTPCRVADTAYAAPAAVAPAAAVNGVMTVGMIPGQRMDGSCGCGGETRRPRPGPDRRSVDLKMLGTPMPTTARYEAVDSHTEGMPTRVITGGVGELPGATMLERKLRLEREHDEIRQLLMNEPRGHAAMSGAILQPPCRERRRLGRRVHRGQRLPADVRARHDRRRHGAGRDRAWSPVTEPETIVRLDVPAGLVEARVRVRTARRRAVTPAQRAGVRARARWRGRRRPLRHGVRRQLLRHRRRRLGRAHASPPSTPPELIAAGSRADGRGAGAGPSRERRRSAAVTT